LKTAWRGPENVKKHEFAVEHFQRLNEWLQQDGSATRYQFNMLTPKGYGIFFTKLREGEFAGFRSELDVAITRATVGGWKCLSAEQRDRGARKMAKKKNTTRFPQGVLALEQIEEQYAGQWVLVEETHWNKSGQPLAGRVIAHSLEKETVVETGVQYGKKHSDVRLFLFYAGEKIPEGVVILL
jgi:hypothetical protein